MASNIKLKNNINSEFTVTHEDNQGAISVSSTDLAKVVSVDTIADLRLTTKPQPTVWVSGYYEKGDGAFGSNIFEWDATSTEDDNGGTIIKLDSIATGRYKLRYSGAVNVKWFGAKGDGVTDDYQAFTAALSIEIPYEDSTSAGLSIYVPLGVYVLSDELQLKKTVEIKGQGGAAPFLPMTKLKFINNTRGIQINRANTIGDTLETVATGSSEGSVIESIWVEGTDVANSYCNGFHLRARAIIRNCRASNFGNDGCHIVATFSSSDPALYGNANTFHLENCSFMYNVRHGFYCDGADVNAGTIHACDSSKNGSDSFHDSSFLGNTYTGCHADPTSGYGYVTDNDNSSTVFLNCYCEVPSLSKGNRRTMFIGGEGISLEDGSTAIAMGGGAYNGLTTKRFIAKDYNSDLGTAAYTILQQYSSNRDILTTKNEDLSEDVFRVKRTTEGDIELFNINNISTLIPAKITGSNTTFTGNRDTPQVGKLVTNNLYLGNGTNTFTRRFSYHDKYSAPSNGIYSSRGEIFLSTIPSAGGTAGWICTTSGAAGSTAVFKTFGNIGV